MHVTQLLYSTTKAPSASSIVRAALRSSGPQTTHQLHALLHSPTSQSSVPLPAQIQPFRSSHLSHLSPSQRRALPASDRAPPPPGQWSVAYLKRKVLANLEARGEVVKVTRARWEATQPGARESRAEAVEAVEAKSAGGKAKGGKQSAAAVQSRKEGQEHVWVEGGVWEEALRRMQVDGLGRVVPQVDGARAEEALRSSYGLESAAA
ncbi:hypothetical protein JCM8547_008373 [Rhodosporidiobolus lusitaniae]